MTLQQRIDDFVQLGSLMQALGNGQEWPGFESGVTLEEYAELEEAILRAGQLNRWFTEENIKRAIRGIASWLNHDIINDWLKAYPEIGHMSPRRVAVIMAGNIPLVGFHDVFCALLAGHQVIAKLSSDDKLLFPALHRIMRSFAPELAAKLQFTEERLPEFDAVIATGSNNTARYFEHYFGKYPHVIRKNRNSVAVLDGTETKEELKELGSDIFSYFGLGCRNVTKLYIPQDFHLDRLFEAIFDYSEIVNHNKYANNYDYHKALWLLNQDQLLDNGFVLLKEDGAIASPVGSLFYERYSDKATVDAILKDREEEIQCVVGHGFIPFGQAQCPGPGDYADGVDTMKFLLNLD